ncbi:MAG: ABC transporter ATP-binding protein [Psittacicella sp.]
MKNHTIIVEHIYKSYPLYHHINAGLKTLFTHPKNILKFFKGSRYSALEDISFKVKKGESIALVGKNGAGKSTMLALLAGVLKPNSGTISINGRVAAMLELGGGFHPELTGRENIYLNAALLGLTKKEIESKVESIIEFSELEDFIDEPIRIYSSGMLAKLGFSVITSVNPDIIIIDEVLAVGDYEFQNKCLQVIKKFKEQGVTIFLVSHSINDVKTFCDKAIWIENKKVKMIGDSQTVGDAYASNF